MKLLLLIPSIFLCINVYANPTIIDVHEKWGYHKEVKILLNNDLVVYGYDNVKIVNRNDLSTKVEIDGYNFLGNYPKNERLIVLSKISTAPNNKYLTELFIYDLVEKKKFLVHSKIDKSSPPFSRMASMYSSLVNSSLLVQNKLVVSGLMSENVHVIDFSSTPVQNTIKKPNGDVQLVTSSATGSNVLLCEYKKCYNLATDSLKFIHADPLVYHGWESKQIRWKNTNINGDNVFFGFNKNVYSYNLKTNQLRTLKELEGQIKVLHSTEKSIFVKQTHFSSTFGNISFCYYKVLSKDTGRVKTLDGFDGDSCPRKVGRILNSNDQFGFMIYQKAKGGRYDNTDVSYYFYSEKTGKSKTFLSLGKHISYDPVSSGQPELKIIDERFYVYPRETSSAQEVVVYDAKRDRVIFRHPINVYGLFFVYKDRVLFEGDNGDQSELIQYDPHSNLLESLFSVDSIWKPQFSGNLISGGSENQNYIFNMETGKLFTPAIKNAQTSLSPDGKQAITVSGWISAKTLYIYNF